MNEVDAAKALVENIARSVFGASWNNAIIEIVTSGLYADENRWLVVRVSSYDNLELLAEQAQATFGFTVDRSLIHNDAIVTGNAGQEWNIMRVWWLELTDTDKGDPNVYPYATPKGVPTRLTYTETRKAPL